ncbi:uncharacterized protein LOC144165866 [Haemaphysalis longicornis]
MFYAHQILHRRRGKFGLLWLAATTPKKIKNSSLLSVSLADLAEELGRSLSRGRLLPGALYSERYSLRLSAKLLTGLWVLYRKKAAALRAKAEECLRLLTTRKRPRDQDVDLPQKKGEKRRRKGSPEPPLSAAAAEPPSAHFGKVLSKEETPEELIVERLPPVPADALTADRERITLREEVPLRLDPLALEDSLFQQEEIPAEGDDFLEELERLMALRDDGRAREEQEAPTPGAQQAEGRPLSPIPPRSSRGGTPPPLRPPSDLAVQEAASELVAEPWPEPPSEAVVEETPEGEPLPAVVDPGLAAAASKPDAEPVAEPDAEAAAVPPAPAVEQQPPEEAVAGPSGLSPPSRRSPRGGGRRRPAASPPAGPAPRRRRRGPTMDRLTQLSMAEMRENMQANNLRGRPAAFQSLAQLLRGPDVEALFRLPGRRLLSERLLRPWKLVQTRPEPDWEEEEEEGEEEPAGGEAGGLQPPEELAPPAGEGRREEEEEEAREQPSLTVPAATPAGDGEEGSLEAGREPSAASSALHGGSLSKWLCSATRPHPHSTPPTGLEAGLAERTSVASLLADIQEEEAAEQQPQHPDAGVVTAEPLVGVGGDLVPVPEEEEGPLEQEEPLPREGGAALPGDHLASGASPGGPAGAAVMGATSAEGAVAASPSPSAQPEEPSGGRLGSLWNRLQEVKDAHGMCTLESLVPPDAFNRRSVAASFATLLRMHKRGMVQLEQFSAYGPVVVTVLEEEEQGTPPVERPHP